MVFGIRSWILLPCNEKLSELVRGRSPDKCIAKLLGGEPEPVRELLKKKRTMPFE